MKPARDIDTLLAIMARLRTPEIGCPWDLEQDFASIAPYTVEEAYEVADAIARGDLIDLRDELGDLLLQVVFHARMAEEDGAFDFGDVVESIARKMIRRHPHIFGDTDARDPGAVKANWAAIKAAERAEKDRERAAAGIVPDAERSRLRHIPRSLPALTLAQKVQARAAEHGFDWKDPAPVLDKIAEEISELRVAHDSGDREAISDELGDLIFSAVNFARQSGFDAEDIARRAVDKFRSRFQAMEDLAESKGLDFDALDVEAQEALWQEVKENAVTPPRASNGRIQV